MVQKLEYQRKSSFNQGKRFKSICVGYIPVLHLCRKWTVCPIVVTTCWFSCWNVVEQHFALQLYLLKSKLKLLLYYPLIYSTNMLFDWLLDRLKRFQQRLRLNFSDVITKITNYKPSLNFPWMDGQIYVFHFERTSPEKKTQKPMTTVEEACNTFERNCLNKYDERVNSYNKLSNTEETTMLLNQVITKQPSENVPSNESSKGNDDRLYMNLLEAKRIIESCIADKYNQADFTEKKTSTSCPTSPSETTDIATQKSRWLFVSYDTLTFCETFAGRIAMPALFICFLREYFEPGHPMLTSQILSLLPLQVYGDIAPSGYNPYITYISGLLKSETETRVTQLVHVIFNLILSSLFAKLNIATNILKILLGA